MKKYLMVFILPLSLMSCGLPGIVTAPETQPVETLDKVKDALPAIISQNPDSRFNESPLVSIDEESFLPFLPDASFPYTASCSQQVELSGGNGTGLTIEDTLNVDETYQITYDVTDSKGYVGQVTAVSNGETMISNSEVSKTEQMMCTPIGYQVLP